MQATFSGFADPTGIWPRIGWFDKARQTRDYGSVIVW
jgi:hypothetical protein